MYRRERAATAALLIVFSATVLLTHTYERLFPIIPIALTISSIIVLSAFIGQDRLVPALGISTFVGSSYMLFMAAWPGSVMGTDPNWIVFWVQSIVETGATNDVGSGFYRSAPFFLLLSSISAIILEMTAREGLLIYPLLLGIIIPLSIAGVVMRAYRHTDAALVASVLTVTAAQTLSFSYTQIPQILSVFFWTIGLLVGIKLVQRTNRRLLVLLLILTIGAVFTHKFAVVIMFVGFVSYYFIEDIANKYTRDINGQNTKNFGLIILMLSCTLFVQWEYVTSYTSRGVDRAIAMLFYRGGSIPESSIGTHATLLNGDLLSILAYAIPVVTFLAAGGIAWLVLLPDSRFHASTSWLLGGAAVTAGFSVIGILASISPSRFQFFAEPTLAAIISILVIIKLKKRVTVKIAIIVLLISLQVFAAPATPDYPDTTRIYLTEAEMDAKTFGETYFDTIHTDSYYARATTKDHIIGQSIPGVYEKYDPVVVNGKIGHEGACVSYRNGSNNIHDEHRDTLKLQWDLKGSLNEQFNRVYSVGDTVIHCDK